MCAKHYQQQRRADPAVREMFRIKARAYRADADKGDARKKRHREYIREWSRGFSPALVAARRIEQAGLCAICPCTLVLGGRSLAAENADHDHDTGEPRGLLCGGCNRSLGIYEKHQRALGLRFAPYEEYLARYTST